MQWIDIGIGSDRLQWKNVTTTYYITVCMGVFQILN